MRTERRFAVVIAACVALCGQVGQAQGVASFPADLLAQASADELFNLDERKKEGQDSDNASTADSERPQSADELFGVDKQVRDTPSAGGASATLTGFYQNELAFTIPSPSHVSKFKNHARLVLQGSVNENVKWKLSGHLMFDGVFSVNDFYNKSVREDQEIDAWLHETYLDISNGDWALRLGRQHIVWGEVVGLFFADVVSALDLREYILPDFDIIRIPQWAARLEHYGDKLHAELIWLPYVTSDQIGEYGAEFFPVQFLQLPPGFGAVFNNAVERDPLEDMAYGARASYLNHGWDIAAFYYSSPDKGTSLQRTITLAPAPLVSFLPVHERIHQFGSTLAKDLGEGLVKAEAVYTRNRQVSVTDAADIDGLAETDELRYLIGYEQAFGQHSVTLQFFQTWFVDHLPSMTTKDLESGIGLYYSTTALHPDVTPELLWIRSFDRNEWVLQGKVSWDIDAHWRLVAGFDVFEGPRAAPLLGQYDARDRIYYELRYSF